ncbi:MAG TPA: FapA family protein [Fibrobacteria bacterium]|nr:FapA family protein [Fibrobacteria bacterium]
MAEDSKDGKPSGENAAPGATQAPTPVGSPADYLEIKAEPQRAVLTIKGAIARAGLSLTREDVAGKLQSLQVVNGVDWTAVDRMIAGKQYDRGQVIAQGTPGTPSRDASIQEKIKIDSDLKPVVDKDGKADYKNVDNIHQVKKGDVLAVKIPAVQGTESKDIFGKQQPAPPPKDIQFKLGTNTAVSADGLELQAAVGGYVYHQAGAVCVGVTYVLKGDVDFHTGNLHYLGDIQVLGNVTDGFTVEAEGNVTVEGTVEGAQVISHGAGVTVKSGVFGHGKGRIAAKTSVHLQSAQDAAIECEDGPVEVEAGLRNCHVTAKSFKGDKSGCSVVGGEIKAFGDVILAVMGGEGCHTHVRILDKDAEAAKARMKDVEHLRAEIEAGLIPIETKLKGMKTLMARHGATMSDRAKAELKGVVDAYSALKKAEKDFDAEKERLGAVMSAAPKRMGTFTVTEKIVWGGVAEFFGHLRELEAEDANKEWLWTPGGGIHSRTIIPATPGKTDPGDSPQAPALPS